MFILASKNDFFSNNLYNTLKKEFNNFIYITDKEELKTKITEINPSKIFFFHWSFIVPKSIYSKYECINIHTSNLPYGKGGSPLQNQILDNITCSRVNALQMSEDGLDAGPIYLFQEVTLQGSLFDIWTMLSNVTYKLIKKIIRDNIKPVKQIEVDTEVYKRRKDNKIPFEQIESLDKIYDFIRMLDSPYYPTPFINIGDYKLEFKRGYFDGDKILTDVTITKSN